MVISLFLSDEPDEFDQLPIETAAKQKQELDVYIQTLKDEERKNALIRKALILNSASDKSETPLY